MLLVLHLLTLFVGSILRNQEQLNVVVLHLLTLFVGSILRNKEQLNVVGLTFIDSTNRVNKCKTNNIQLFLVP